MVGAFLEDILIKGQGSDSQEISVFKVGEILKDGAFACPLNWGRVPKIAVCLFSIKAIFYCTAFRVLRFRR